MILNLFCCDDEERVRHQLKTALEWKNSDGKLRHERSMCRVYRSGTAGHGAGQSARCLLLDVDLKDGVWDGFALGQELRRRDPHGTLVYITSYGDLAWKTFQYHLEAFDYIVKEGGTNRI